MASEIQEIQSLVKIGNTSKTIGKKLNISSFKVDEIIKENGFKPDKFEIYDDAKILELYKLGTSTNVLGDMFGVSKGKIQRTLKSLNVELRVAGEIESGLTVDDNYFTNIDTKEKAYWLGYLIEKAEYSNLDKFTVIFSDPEVNQMNKFLDAIKYSDKSQVKKMDWTKYVSYKITFTSKQFCESLNKNKILLLENEYYNSYLLGIMDSSGNFNIHGKEYRIHFYVQRDVCDSIKRFLSSKEITFTEYNYKQKNNNLDLCITGNDQIRKLSGLLYPGNECFYDEENYKVYTKLVSR